MIKTLTRPFVNYKYLLWQLTLRDIKARYKQSFVGYAWVILNPLAQLVVYSFVFSVVFRFPTNNVPYVIYLYSALLPWTLMQNSIASATQSLIDNASLLKKVAFPREVIPYATVIAKLVDFFFSSLLFLVLMWIMKVPYHLSILWFLPILGIQLTLTIGVSLLLSAFNLFYRDIQYLTNLLMMLWMYMSPIVYPLSLVPSKYIWIYKLNPMVGVMEGYRSAVFGYPFELSILAWSGFVAIIVFSTGFMVFKKTEQHFADVV